MTEDQIAIIQGWKPDRRAAALLLAQGYTWEYTAAHVGVVEKTIANWKKDPVFEEWVSVLRARAIERVEPALFANFELALDLQRRMFIGEIEPDDRRYIEARTLINRFVDKAFDAGAPAPAPTQAAQFNIYGGTTQQVA